MSCFAHHWSSYLKIFENYWPSASNFKSFSQSLEQFFQPVKGQNNFWQQNAFLTCSWRLLISKKIEQSQFKFEKIIGIEKHAGKVRKFSDHITIFFGNFCHFWRFLFAYCQKNPPDLYHIWFTQFTHLIWGQIKSYYMILKF